MKYFTMRRPLNKKRISTATSGSIDACSSYYLDGRHLKIDRDGSTQKYPLSERGKKVGYISSVFKEFSAGEELSNDIIPIELLNGLTPSMEAFLIRYLCDDENPVPSLPALTIQELQRVAEIETYLMGTPCPGFWEDYGFESNFDAINTLTGAQTSALQPTAEVSLLEQQLASAFVFRVLSPTDLELLRWSVDDIHIPFIYGAMRHKLKSIVIERKSILDSVMLDQTKKSVHLKWMYRALNETVAPQLISEERDAILRSMMVDEPGKVRILSALYSVGRAHLTQQFISEERCEILKSITEAPTFKDRICSSLYSAGRAHLNPKFISEERDAILKFRMVNEVIKGDFLGGLYSAGWVHLTQQFIAQERDGILSSTGVMDIFKGRLCGRLYSAVRAYLTPQFISEDRNAILISTKVRDVFKAAIVESLYLAGRAHLTQQFIEEERAAIQASGASERCKSDAIKALCSGQAKPILSHN